MANERSLAVDIAYVGIGTPGDGVPATDYTRYPIIHEDSVVFNFNEASQVNFKAMGMDDPWAVMNKRGDPSSIEFAIPSPTAEEMLAFCGGTITGQKWEAPKTTPSIIKSVKLQTKPYEGKYTEYVITRASIAARLSQAPGSEQTDLLLVKATITIPASASGDLGAPYSREVKEVVAPDPPQNPTE